MKKLIFNITLAVALLTIIVIQTTTICSLKEEVSSYENYFNTVEGVFTIMHDNSEQTFQDFIESYEYCDYYHYKQIIIENYNYE